MPDWGFIAAGLVVLALGLSVALWSLFADRSKGRERCPRCWYDMSAIPGDTAIRCPECGRVAAARREFARTRRRWRTATAFFILAVVGSPLLVVPVVRKSGWWALVPTEVLIRTVDAEGALTTPGRTEFARRLMAGDVSTRQWGHVLKRAAPAAIKTREKWPIGVPLVGEVAFPREFVQGAAGTASVYFGPVAEVSTSPLSTFPRRRTRSYMSNAPAVELGVRTDGEPRTARITIDCEFFLPSIDASEMLGTGAQNSIQYRIDRTIQFTSSADECVRPVSITSVDDALQSGIRFSIARIPVPSSEQLPAGWMYHLRGRPDESQSLLPDIGAPCFAARVEFEYDGRLVASAEWIGLTRFHFDWTKPLRGDCEAVYRADPLDPKWTMKIIGDPNIALRDRKATKYWSGTVQVPFPGQTPVSGP